MKTISGIVKKAILGFPTPNEHEGYVVEILTMLKDGPYPFKTKWVALTTPKGSLPEECEKFVGRACLLHGDQVGLMFQVKMIESNLETWSI